MKYKLIILLFINTIYAQNKSNWKYMGQTPPEDSAIVFAPGVVSIPNRYEEKFCYASNGMEIFFGIHTDSKDYFNPKILHMKYENDTWTKADTASFSKNRKAGWPISSLNGSRIFMEEVIVKTKTGVICQIVFSRKLDGGWYPLETLIPDIKTKEGVGLAQMTNDSTLYFYDRAKRVAYYSKLKNGKYAVPIALPYRINPATEFCVSPQNDYILFCPITWDNNFHISFKDKENEWSMPIPVSSYFKKRNNGWDGKGVGPSISPDGKYLFFSFKQDIYWIATNFIEELRKQAEW